MNELKHLVYKVATDPKWYAVTEDGNEQKWLIINKHRILKGRAKLETIIKFFDKLGYKLNVEYKLEKK